MRSALLVAVLCIANTALAQNLLLDSVSPPIPLTNSTSIAAVQIDPATGNVTVRSSAGNLTQCGTGGGGNPAVITSFSVNPNSVAPNGQFTISWSATNTNSGNPCTPSNGVGTTWASQGQLQANDSRTLTAPSSVGTITFTLTCAGPGGSDVESTSLTVSNGGGGGNCTPVGNPNTAPWNGYFSGVFPLTNPTLITLNSSPVDAISFTSTSSTFQSGSVRTVFDGGPTGSAGNIRFSMSTTAGCFSPGQLGNNCFVDYTPNPALAWQIGGSSAAACVLSPGQTYYLNMQGDTSCVGCTRQFQSQSIVPDGQ